MTAVEQAQAAWIMAGFDSPTPTHDINILKPGFELRFELGKSYTNAGVRASFNCSVRLQIADNRTLDA